jgi:hypothetical protein
MKLILPLAAALALGACAAPDGTPMVYDGTFLGTVKEITHPGSTFNARLDENDQKCQQNGFKPGSDDYAKCRHELDAQIR